ncbi:MAG: hypothetical protein LBK26_00490 [Rickettsiales bacterium]|jgi:hypothetical protein|nr:hypothetical protein [Rickettsiales bacterium]
MKEKNSIIAARLLNLYRSAHVIDGGWRAVNAVFISDANADVLEELKKLPNGGKLAQHIRNLQDGKTPVNSISHELMPYGGMMESAPVDGDDAPTGISDDDLKEIESALENFKPDQEHLDAIRGLPSVRQFGDRWLAGIRVTIAGRPDLLDKWRIVYSADRAFSLWSRANEILSWTPSARTRAEVQADMPEYETYLPMFGDAGKEMLVKLRAFISSM